MMALFRSICSLPILLAMSAHGASTAPVPVSPRDFFNVGTRQLQDGKLREAEASLETALASQKETLQSPALYNLGLVRFDQGVQELKKEPNAKGALTRGRSASESADKALRQAEEALAGKEVQSMVAAYLRGRGARRELKAATEAVQRALKVYGAALGRWERSLGDFNSARELNTSDGNSKHNAEVVDRSIAKLIDSLREMQQCANGMGSKSKKLGQMLQQLKGQIPAPNMPPGAAGEDEEEEDQPKGPQPGQEEGPAKTGQEISITPEQAAWLLEAYKLDGERRLPMGDGPAGKPRERSRPTW